MIEFLNVPIKILQKEDIFNIKNYPAHLVTLNAQYFVRVQKDKILSKIVCNSFTCIDGEVPRKLIKILFPKLQIQKLSGSDLIYDFCDYATSNKLRIFLLGGNGAANKKSVEVLREKYKVTIEGYSNSFEKYPFSPQTIKDINERLEDFKPDILFVGYGLPKQDYWINDNFSFLKNIGVKFIVGSGGTFEFVSNKIKRAPKMIQKLGLEMIFRFFMEPNKSRLKRIFESLPLFLYFIKLHLTKRKSR